MVVLQALKEDLERYKKNADFYREKLNENHKDSEFIKESLKKLEKEIVLMEKLIEYGESISSKKTIKSVTVEGIKSVDYDCFCLDVDKPTYLRIKNQEPDEYDISYFNNGMFRLYPSDLTGIENNRVRMTIDILEEE